MAPFQSTQSPLSPPTSQESVDASTHTVQPRSPRDYAKAVSAYASVSSLDSLHPGSNFASLAAYLSQAYQSHPGDSDVSNARPRAPKKAFEFLVYYDLKKHGALRRKAFDSPSALETSKLDDPTETEHSNIILLRGYPSPDWLNTVGAKFDVDPDFFRQHLDFRYAKTIPHDFSQPTLPAATPNMTRLRISTIGSRLDKWRSSKHLSQRSLDNFRGNAAKCMADYSATPSRGRGADVATGDSVVRSFSVLDNEHFVIEQDITVYLDASASGHTVLWLDMGDDLGDGPVGPWNDDLLTSSQWVFNYLPTIEPRPFSVFKNPGRAVSRAVPAASRPAKIPQTSSLLHLDYGQRLTAEAVAEDPLTALEDVFRFAAFSENQYLNAVEMVLKNELDPAALLHQQNPTISNMLYLKQSLDTHISRLKANVSFIKCCKTPKSVQASTGTLTPTAQKFLGDFDYLVASAQRLSAECDRGMNITMNNAVIQESKKAMLQAEGVARLTRLAFFFIPLSLTTSFFGMNFREFVPGTSLSIWIWFAASIPVFAIAVSFLVWDIPRDLRTLASRGQRSSSRPPLTAYKLGV